MATLGNDFAAHQTITKASEPAQKPSGQVIEKRKSIVEMSGFQQPFGKLEPIEEQQLKNAKLVLKQALQPELIAEGQSLASLAEHH